MGKRLLKNAFFHWVWTLYAAVFTGARTGLKEMGSHILRSILSALGVLFGVFVMVVLLSLMGGLQTFLNDRLGQWIGAFWIFENRDPTREQLAEFSRSRGLRFQDGIFLEDSVESVDLVYKVIQRRAHVESYAGKGYARLRGVDMSTLEREFTINKEFMILRGRNLEPDDFSAGKANCVLSSYQAEKILKKMRETGEDTAKLIGSTIRYQNAKFEVVGVFGPREGEIKRWQRHNIYVPLKAMQKHVTGFNPDPGYLWVKVDDPMHMQYHIAEIIGKLIGRHRGVEDIEYRKPEFLNNFIGMMNNVVLIMGILAAISLMAGGLGIMNVMLSSISERVREIGIRKALGANTIQIFVQFISETSILCFIGGFIGAFLGCIPMAFGEAIKKATDDVIEPTLLFKHIVLVFLVIFLMGIVFGMYPAVKASRMNPIDALRYE
jgi:putative ABC transport system permease protein